MYQFHRMHWPSTTQSFVPPMSSYLTTANLPRWVCPSGVSTT